MIKVLFFALSSLFLFSCTSLDTAMTYPNTNNSYPIKTGQTAIAVEREFQQMNSNYKQNTKELLEVMMSDVPNDSRAAISVENLSKCNFVLSVSGNGAIRKIPIGIGQTRGVVVPKGNYDLSAQVCASVYQQKKSVQSNINLQLKD